MSVRLGQKEDARMAGEWALAIAWGIHETRLGHAWDVCGTRLGHAWDMHETGLRHGCTTHADGCSHLRRWPCRCPPALGSPSQPLPCAPSWEQAGSEVPAGHEATQRPPSWGGYKETREGPPRHSLSPHNAGCSPAGLVAGR